MAPRNLCVSGSILPQATPLVSLSEDSSIFMFNSLEQVINDDYVDEYKRCLLLLRSGKLNIPFKRVMVNNCTPLVNECYDNVNRFVAENSQYLIQYGWLIFEDSEKNETVFEAHAVVKNIINTELFEITPTFLSLPFVISMLEDDKFEELVIFLHGKNSHARLNIPTK